ncbi:LamG-like jellyroll fold domain-containing protein [Nocardioides aquiterrae]|uniref:LamG-like jellyroll fold domain-containing protein n=1 Tax=Nocardioides aquiterrae TaxID=203799 RepID=A0ABN1UEE5_9ACTN
MSRTIARRRALTCAVATVLAVAATLVLVRPAEAMYTTVVAGSSPIAYYRLGEAAGPTMTDSSGNAHHGTYAGGVTLGGAPAITVDTNTSASFDGTGSGTASGIAAPTTAYTLEAWIRPTSGDGTIVGQVGGGRLFLGSGQLALDQTGDVLTGPAVPLGTWSHVAATWDGTNTRLFLDGTQVATTATALTAPSGAGDVYVGSDGVTGFQGDLDEVAYYGTALPAATIADHVVVGTDATAPTITITVPADKQHFVLHGFSPSYSCSDPGGSGIESCTATPAAHDLGPHLFTVQATDRAGNTATKSVAYVVDPYRYGDDVVSRSPIAYYRLDQAVGSTTMTDSSGHGHDGTLMNGAVPGARRSAGISCERRPHPPRSCELTNDPQGWSTHFGGLGYGYVNDVAAPRTAYTLEAWIRRDDHSDGSIVGQGGAGQLYVVNDRLALRQTQDDVVSPGPALPVGDWVHVAATWDGSTTRLYVDGSQVASSSSANKPPSGFATVYVGQGERAPTFRGDIDEVAYYDTAISAHVIGDHWMVGSAYDHPSLTPGNSPFNTAEPTIDTTSPVNNGLYAPAKVPVAAFTCADPDGPGDIASCTATVDGNPIASGDALPDSLGVHTFTVTAVDQSGNTYVHSHTYTVMSFADVYRADSPVAYYRLGDVDEVMADDSGNGRDGEYKNDQESGPIGISGDLDHARRFWGDSGYGFANSIAAAPYQATVEAWANPDDGTRDQSIGGLAGSDELFVAGGLFGYRHLDRVVMADVGPNPGNFRQVVGVWDGVDVLIYVDGVLHGSAPAATGKSSAGGGTFYVGYGHQGPWFAGSLDEVAYYATALSPERVYQHFLADPPPPVAATQGGTGCLVPELRGLRLRTAKTELEWANCSLGTVRTKRAAAWKRGYVLRQSVPADSVRRAGFPVNVTVGR